MKKQIISLGLLALLSNFIFAQETVADKKDDFKRWQIRLRTLAIIPNEGDDLPGAQVEIDEAYVPEVDFTYFFTKHWAAELILATANHDVDLKGGPSLGDVWLLPPTLNLQYHFYAGDLKPYLGAGVNYTIFYNEDKGDVLDMNYDDSFGVSFQGGIDYFLNDKWFVNLDFKYLILSTDVEATLATEPGFIRVPVDVDIDPLIIGLGVGFRF
ncbi:MAG: OmpW family protein [Flavobacteriales bacterium CG_4_9_14_3_um_filter_40_17]|nr:MAG: OmpW family protein [Flavobacteriales bacterium CG_4_9_14_3_um_filter_40_17]